MARQSSGCLSNTYVLTAGQPMQDRTFVLGSLEWPDSGTREDRQSSASGSPKRSNTEPTLAGSSGSSG